MQLRVDVQPGHEALRAALARLLYLQAQAHAPCRDRIRHRRTAPTRVFERDADCSGTRETMHGAPRRLARSSELFRNAWKACQRFGQAAVQSPFSNVVHDFPFTQPAQSVIWLVV